MKTQTASFIDFRILSSPRARGLINAMAGYRLIDPSVLYLVNQQWQIELLLNSGVKREKIVEVAGIGDLRVISGGHVILPIQRARLDVLILRLLGKISLTAFVHDLHFLSRRALLRKEFRGRLDLFKKYYYSLCIKGVDEILVDSRFVQRQVRYIYNKPSKIVQLIRVFSINLPSDGEVLSHVRDFDFFIPLTDCDYKGMWALEKLFFKSKPSRILVNIIFSDKVGALIRKRNPHCDVVGVDLSSDSKLALAYSRSKCTLILSRHEGFGFSPYEAISFGSSPIVLNHSSFIEVGIDCFHKKSSSEDISIEAPDQYPMPPGAKRLALRHIKVKIGK